jgi:hypothetical protein
MKALREHRHITKYDTGPPERNARVVNTGTESVFEKALNLSAGAPQGGSWPHRGEFRPPLANTRSHTRADDIGPPKRLRFGHEHPGELPLGSRPIASLHRLAIAFTADVPAAPDRALAAHGFAFIFSLA